MKLPDVNIWFALSVRSHPHHNAVMGWFHGQESPASLFFCRATQQGYLRLLTTTAVMKSYELEAASNRIAWELFADLLNDPRILFTPEPSGIDETWKSLALRKTPSPKLWMDAYLAATAIRSGFQLVSADKAFSQFKGLDFHLIGGN